MLSEKQLVSFSKFISLVLRHSPEIIGLKLDSSGWAKISDLIDGANANGKKLTREILDEVVERNNKKRFAVSEDGLSIRASQGHSIDVDLQLTPQQPPEVLYHGTCEAAVESILRRGLVSRNRQYVHLSMDTETAMNVGRRHGKPVVLVVDAARMHKDGLPFFLSENQVWLTKDVPPQYLTQS